MSAVLAALGGGEAVSGIVKTVGGVIDDLVTTDEERAAAELETRKLDQQLLMGQIETNKEEAKHASMWVAGWRPGLGWVCVASLGLYYIPKAVMLTSMWTYAAGRVIWSWGGAGDFPELPLYPDFGVADILGLAGTLLGTASLRTVEKVKGVAASAPLTPFSIFGAKKAPSAADQVAP